MKIQGQPFGRRKLSYQHHLGNIFLFALLLCISLLLSACGGGSSNDPKDPEGSTASGYVIDGPISGSTVTLHLVNLDGSTGEQVAGPFTTDSNGQWTGIVPNNASGHLVVVAVGGQYTDDATNEIITLSSEEVLHSWFDTSDFDGKRVVSPISDTLWQVAQKEMSQGVSLSDAIDTTEQLANDFWRFNPTNLVPDETSGNASMQRYGVMLAAFSFLLENNSELQIEPFNSMPRFSLVRLLVNDMADGRLDGLDIEDRPILAAGGTPLPTLSRHDLSAFFKEANDRAEALQIDPAETEPHKQHNHYTYSLSCPKSGFYIYGPYVDNLPSGTNGVSDILPSLPGRNASYD